MRRETRFNGCSPISVDINTSVTNQSNWSNQIKQHRRLSPAVAAVLTFPVAVIWSSEVEIVLCVDILTEPNAGKKQGDICRERDIAPSAVATILSDREKIVKLHRESQLAPSRKCLRLGNYQTVNDAALTWFKDARQHSVPLSGPIIQEKARQFTVTLGTSGFDAKVNIRRAAEMLTGSWWNVKASTIRNCWQKAGLLETLLTPQDCEPTPRDCDDKAKLDPELWNRLTEKLPVDAAVTFEDYVDSDCAAATSAELTCKEIKTRSYLGCCKDVPDDMLRKVADMEADMHQRLLSTRQKKITDFFKQ
ncbi:hypothetical protein HPB52_006426 [Rhipicephalus sanguineus]|uniref:HTH CENPB-type domain-containing protein n=1 Tax=Rhipicephalus sanguineus TaxID=34632 RepID=A0A9D4T1M6_RHISA|nr:hypothetical protein HPB52_006426 [Rhipicephalus sanguineus]